MLSGSIKSVAQQYDEQYKNAAAQYDLAQRQSEQSRDRSLQDTYISYMKGKRNVPQMLSSMGYSGGPAETSMLKLDTEYGNNRNTLERTYADKLKELALERTSGLGKIQSEKAAALAQLYYQQAMLNLQQQALAAQSSGGGGGYYYSGGGDDTPKSPTTYQRAYTGTTTTDPVEANRAWVNYYKR